jgi:hypothetical protein
VPIISVDSKTKELIGDFKHAGYCWCLESIAVNIHDFLGDSLGRAVPYGIYDVLNNRGTVYVGNSAETLALPSMSSATGRKARDGQPFRRAMTC